MKNVMIKAVAMFVLGASVVGCSSSGLTKQQRNTAIGAAVGAAAGHAIGESTGATLGGAALGGLIGSQIK